MNPSLKRTLNCPPQFRVALQLSRQREEYLTSEESVVISTLEQGKPSSTPRIVSAIAVDHSRISVTWEPGPFPNGPILSYALEIVDLQMNHSSYKVSNECLSCLCVCFVDCTNLWLFVCMSILLINYSCCWCCCALFCFILNPNLWLL